MKILVPLKRVADPDNANKVKIPASGDKIETTGLEWKPNPFDEYALEAALRLTENGKAPKQRLGEVVVVTLGPKECEQTLRSALATGADRAIRVDTTDEALDGRLVARQRFPTATTWHPRVPVGATPGNGPCKLKVVPSGLLGTTRFAFER